MTRQMARFDQFEVDFRSRELRKGGVRVRLQDQPFQILSMLLERAGDVVTREEIRDRLWPDGTFVDFEHSMNAAIKRLRAALGDAAESPRFVETLHRRGYRFVATVEQPDVSGTPAGTPISCSRPRLVVLPFANLGTDAPDYFSDGLTEEMIMQLGRRCSDRIGVLARTSSMLYKNVMRGASDIGEALRADYLVEGSVRCEGDRVRITAQLIETKGETHLWANSYDRTMADCLAVQTEVATEIAIALATELIPVPSATVDGHPPCRVRIRHFSVPGSTGTSRPTKGCVDAIAGYDESIALDPSYGKAYSGRARARLALCDYYRVEPRGALEVRARRCSSRARDRSRRCRSASRGRRSRADARVELDPAQKRPIEPRWQPIRTTKPPIVTTPCFSPRADGLNRSCSAIVPARSIRCAFGSRRRLRTVHYLRGDYRSAIRRYRQVLGMEPRHVTRAPRVGRLPRAAWRVR